MNHYIAYHKVKEWGEYLIDPEQTEIVHYSGHPKSKLEKMIGQTVWVVSGKKNDSSMIYKLCSTYKVTHLENDEVESTGLYRVVGEGFGFIPQIEINSFPWFAELFREQSRFSFGLNQIKNADVIQALEQMRDNYINNNPPIDSKTVETFTPQEELQELAQIENLTVDDYKTAFTVLREQMTESDLLMLKAHYEALNYDITATQLANKVGFRNFETTNLRYGLLASKFLELFQIQVVGYAKLNALVGFDKCNDEWHWILLPQVVQALRELGWFGETQKLNALQEINQFKDSYEVLSETTRESIIQSRIGQGQFRALLIEYWQGCAVSGCKQIELLRASHIKPWRYSSNAERLDPYNGLLLLPNLDACFDAGLVSFDDVGKILISSELRETALLQLGIKSNLRLLRIEQRHKDFLRFHRENIFHDR